MTGQEEQDNFWKSRGFYPYREDYECPDISGEEWGLLVNLRIAMIVADSDLSKKLEGRDFFERVAQEYRTDKDRVKGLVNKITQENSSIKLPNETLLEKIGKRSFYDDIVDFIIHDGGEIREDKAYEQDGNTIKPGWKRLYWK